ncbi:hypothetical protein [Arthrobacter cavernae]|uniref:Lipoprotein n=1 Tax=Arthrobacter cavernae TaxID=2817681 RepID=A0A939KNP1_9MICC|nr:hypothetical protein [Arthrobacter cavernae]MBO1269503.1 hypothetical protein [Arthrobacter cavernae]
MKKPLALLAAALLCTSCAQAAGTSPEPPAKSSTSAAPSAPVSLSAGSGPQAPGATPPATMGITWDEAGRKSAVEVAERAMADFARPRTEATRWANDLARWMTPQATADYSAVDPATIPATRLTGPARLTVDEANGYGAAATVPTDAGTYTVQLLRTAKDSPWKVHRLTPPAS